MQNTIVLRWWHARWATACVGLLLGSIPVSGAAVDGVGSAPLAFTLKDQFDQEYTEKYCADRTAILMVADRSGSAFVGAWSDAIQRELASVSHPPTQWVGVATLPGIPWFLRGMIKGKFPKDKARWTLMDWDGQLAKRYALAAERANILVFAPDRRLVYRGDGREVDPAVVKSVITAIVNSAP